MVYRFVLFMAGVGMALSAVTQLRAGAGSVGLLVLGIAATCLVVAWRGFGSRPRVRRRAGVSESASAAVGPAGGGFTVRSGGSGRAADLPLPPTRADYVAAGVDLGKCSLCPKKVPANPREWRFAGFDGRPAVVCPACWNRRFVYPDAEESDAFYKRFTTRWTFEKP